HEEHGNTLPAVTEKALWDLDGWIMGPIGHAAYPRNDATWVMPPVRKKYELFAAVLPSRSYPNVVSFHNAADIVFVRELTDAILPDIAAGLAGGLGLAPGLCVGECYAMAQATHGSAPDIAGRNVANPYAMIMSGQMLLAWLGRKRGEPKASAAANHIAAAVER